MKPISRTFLTGLITILPLIATFYLLFWLAAAAESLLGRVIRNFLSDEYYWPGMGLLMALALIFSVGLLMRTWAVRRFVGYGEALLYRYRDQIHLRRDPGFFRFFFRVKQR